MFGKKDYAKSEVVQDTWYIETLVGNIGSKTIEVVATRVTYGESGLKFYIGDDLVAHILNWTSYRKKIIK